MKKDFKDYTQFFLNKSINFFRERMGKLPFREYYTFSKYKAIRVAVLLASQ